MMTRHFDHIDLRVRDMEVAKKFYGKLLPELGFVHESLAQDFHTFYSGGGDRASEFFRYTHARNHHPNGTRTACWTETRGEADRIPQPARQNRGDNLEQAQHHSAYKTDQLRSV